MMLLRNKKLRFYFLVLLVLAGLIYLIQWNPLKPAIGKVGKVVREDLIQRVTIAGMVVPYKRTIITAPYNGYIKKLFVKIGDKVKKGDPIVSVVQSLQSTYEVFPIRAPFDGVVVQQERSEGEYVKEADAKDFIVRLDDLDRLYVSAAAPEIDRVRLRENQTAIIKASAILNRSYKGIIRELSLAAREKETWSRSQVVEFPIKVEITEKDDGLRPGMSVLIDVITEKKEKVLLLRHEYIRSSGEQKFVILKNGKRRNIEVGQQNEESIEILSGLTEGDVVRQVDFTQLDQGE